MRENVDIQELVEEGRKLYESNNYEEAIPVLEKIIQNSPDLFEPWFYFGKILEEREEYKSAIEKFERAAEIQPKNSAPWAHLAYNYSNLGEFDLAFKNYNIAINNDPKDDQTWNSWGYALFENQQYDEAEQKFKTADKLKPNTPVYLVNWGMVLVEQNRTEEAIELFKKAIDQNSSYPHAWYHWGRALEKEEKFEEALEKYNQTKLIDFAYVDAWDNYFSMLIKLQRYGEVEKALEEATHFNLSSLPLWEKRITYYKNLKENDEVEKLYADAVSLNPEQSYFLTGWGFHLRNNNQQKAAIEKFQLAISLDKADQEAWLGWVLCLQELGKIDEAQKIIESAKQYFPDIENDLKDNEANENTTPVEPKNGNTRTTPPPEETPETPYEKAERLIQEAIQNKSVHLNLSGLGLTKLPAGFAKMEALNILSLDNNLLFDLSKEVGKLQNLNTLSLNNNRFKTWPVSIFQLKNLTELDLRNNKLKNIDDLIFKLKRLKRLYLLNNPLEPLNIEIKKKLGELEYVDIELEIPQEDPLEQTVKPVYDSPTFIDKLGRSSFAIKIADMLRFIWGERMYQIYDESTPIMLHLHGPWGSGKSSLINFIKINLEYPIPSIIKGKFKASSSWKVIEFNAWRNQHVDPPWWALYSEIRREGFGRREKFALAVSSYFTRLFKTKAPYIFGVAILSAALFLNQDRIAMIVGSGFLEKSIKIANGAIALLSSVLSFFIAFGRALTLTSAENASQYMIEKDSPMNAVRKSFNKLMDRSKKPILVVIDDMDRCHTSYTVKLLEGVQTLFAHRNVAYLVAADRRWLYSCYETTYSDFSGNIQEPGKPLGAHFLEKAFDFSFPVPGISEEAKEAYWKELIGLEEGEIEEETNVEAGPEKLEKPEIQEEKKDPKSPPRARPLKEKKEKYKEEYRKNFAGKSVEEKYNALKDLKKNFTQQQAMREVIVEESGKKEALESTEHFLRQFWQLVEPNPRAMKRLLNAYSIQMDLATLMGLEMGEAGVRKQLVLFTIVAMRWPLLEREIIKNPQIGRKILNPNDDLKLDDDIQEIINRDSDIQKVFQGGDTGVELDEKALLDFRKIQPEINVDGSVA